MDPYEWDEAKYAVNLLKHQISFELVYQFDWSTAQVEPDSASTTARTACSPSAE